MAQLPVSAPLSILTRRRRSSFIGIVYRDVLVYNIHTLSCRRKLDGHYALTVVYRLVGSFAC